MKKHYSIIYFVNLPTVTVKEYIVEQDRKK